MSLRLRLVSADIRFCSTVAMNVCPLTAIRPLPVIGERKIASAAYWHLGDVVAVDSAGHSGALDGLAIDAG